MKESKRPLTGLLVTQFFGAFNDNAWKLMVTFLGIQAVRLHFSGTASEFELVAQMKTTIAFSALTLPLIIFSLFGGWFADRFSKRSVIIFFKWFEVLIMFGATLALGFAHHDFSVLVFVLALLGVQSAFFSPAKYGIISDLVPPERLTDANSQMELWTFLAIILGTASGGLLLSTSENPVYGGFVLVVFSVIGLAASYSIPHVPIANASGRWFEGQVKAWKTIRRDRVLLLAVAGSVFFWGLASLLGQNVLVYSKVVLGLSDKLSGLPLALCGIGVGVGSLLASKLSGPKIEVGLVPVGTLGLALPIFLLGWLSPGFWGVLFLMFLVGVSSACMIVPLQALMQWRSPNDFRGAVLALANVFVFSGIFAGTLLVGFFAQMGLSSQTIFFISSAVSVIAVVWVLYLLPEALLRMILFIVAHSLYRVKVIGGANVPSKGGVLLAPNHVSFVDALFLVATVDRRVRFLVDVQYFENPFFKPIMKSMGCIPISSAGGPKLILRALRDAGKYLDDGEVVCIFPEGQLTRTGTLQPFKRGLEKIIRDRKAVVVPVHLDRVWGSIFSREGGRYLTKLPKQFPYPITVSFGEPLPSETSIHQIRSAVQAAGTEAWMARKESAEPLHYQFIQQVRRDPTRLLFADAKGTRISRVKALISAISIARKLGQVWSDQKNIGILLPPSIGGALVNLSVSLSGKTTVNLNYTTGRAGLETSIRQASIETIITSREFIELAELPDLSNISKVIFLEDISKQIGFFDRLSAFVIAILPRTRWIERLCGAKIATKPDDLATIIFSSGSTAEPKGVMLSHFNIDANTDGMAQIFRANKNDSVLGILPFFHSFGYASFWFAMKEGLAVPLHPKPLDVAVIGDLVQKFGITILLATPTFLQFFMRRCTPAQFGSIRILMTGAEKLNERLAISFEDQFGVKPLDGYGATECSPAIAASVPDFRAPGFFQPGSRRGFVGQPLPGVSVKIVDPETGERTPEGTPGLLFVRGPNIMQGYLGKPELTNEVIQKGWYMTGDIALVDEDGFLKITDRLSRFSKIGGEMVPHGKVEDALHEAAELEIKTFLVTAISDEQKGECLAVVHTYHEEKLGLVLERLSKLGLPNLFLPRIDKFVKVEQLPVLGTGKIDLRAVKQIASERLGKKTAA